MFTILDRLFFEPPTHVRDAEEVRRVVVERSFLGRVFSSRSMAHPDVNDLEAHSGLESYAAYAPWEMTLETRENASKLRAVVASYTLFPLLGVSPQLGRFYGEDDDRLGAPPVAVVSHEYWTGALGGSREVLGRPLRLGGTEFTIVGVAPRGFTGAELAPVDVWVPLSTIMSLSADDLVSGGTYTVTVVSPAPGGGESGTATLTVGDPQPAVTSVSPLAVDAGSGAFTLNVEGSGFIDGASTIRFGNSSPATTFESATRLSASVSADQLTDAAFVDVYVTNPGPGGGGSDPVEFTIRAPVPVLESASPTTIVGGTDTRISVVGEHFMSTTLLVWNGSGYAAEVVSPSVLYVDLPGSAFMTGGPATIEVFTPPPGGGTSDAIEATVVDAPPRITGFAPPSIEAGSGAFTLTIEGVNFSADSEVLWDGIAKATTYVDDQTLEVDVSAANVAEAGSGMIVVDEPGVGESQVVGFPVLPAMPSSVDSVSLALTTSDLVTDPSGDVIYAAVPSTAAMHANELVALDPLAGVVLWHTPAGSDPKRVVVSDDGAYVYVALGGAPAVARIDVAAQQKDLDITLPASSHRVEDLLVLAGTSTAIVVSLRNTCCSPRHEGVAIFNGAAQKPLRTQGHTGSNRIEPSSHGERIYGYNNETTEFGFRRILVLSDGLLQDGVYGGVVTGFGTDIVYDGGLIFSTRGRVVEPESRTLLGTIPGSGIMRPDVANGRVHFFSGGELTSYHSSAFTVLGSATLPTASGLSLMVRFGADGLAFGGGERVLFVRSDLIGS